MFDPLGKRDLKDRSGTGIIQNPQIFRFISYSDHPILHNRAVTIFHPYSRRIKDLCKNAASVYATFQKGIEHQNPEICANVIICLIKLTCYLFKKQIISLEQDFLKKRRPPRAYDPSSLPSPKPTFGL